MRPAKVGNERVKKGTGRMREHRLQQTAMEQQMRRESFRDAVVHSAFLLPVNRATSATIPSFQDQLTSVSCGRGGASLGA